MNLPTLPLTYQLRPPRLKIARPPLLVLLHGQAGSEKDMMNFAAALDERLAAICLRAPFEHTPGAYNWFRAEMISGKLLANVAQLEFSRQTLAKLLPAAVEAWGINPAQVYLLGFGQGAVVAWSAFIANPELAAGIIGIDGQIPPEIRSLAVAPDRFRGRAALLLHGWQDEIYPIAQAYAARELLARYPLRLDYREYPTGHYLTQDSLLDANDWLADRLDEARITGAPEPPPFTARLGRVQIKVRNLDRAIPFYMRFLGLQLVERVGNAYALLSAGGAQADVILQNAGANAPTPHPEAVGVLQASFSVPDPAAFARAYRTLVDAGLPLNTLDHHTSWGLSFKDPDGNPLEIFWDSRSLPGRSQLWQGRELPLEPAQILAALETSQAEE